MRSTTGIPPSVKQCRSESPECFGLSVVRVGCPSETVCVLPGPILRLDFALVSIGSDVLWLRRV